MQAKHMPHLHSLGTMFTRIFVPIFTNIPALFDKFSGLLFPSSLLIYAFRFPTLQTFHKTVILSAKPKDLTVPVIKILRLRLRMTL